MYVLLMIHVHVRVVNGPCICAHVSDNLFLPSVVLRVNVYACLHECITVCLHVCVTDFVCFSFTLFCSPHPLTGIDKLSGTRAVSVTPTCVACTWKNTVYIARTGVTCTCKTVGITRTGITCTWKNTVCITRTGIICTWKTQSALPEQV